MSPGERDEQIRDLLPIVKKLARRLKRLVPTFDLDDLVGDGSVGLIRAVDSFDPHRGPELCDYARRLVVGAMLNGIRRMDPVSERSRRIVRDGENRRYSLAAALGAVPTSNEMEQRYPGYRRAIAAAYRGQPLSPMRRCRWENRSSTTGATTRRGSWSAGPKVRSSRS